MALIHELIPKVMNDIKAVGKNGSNTQQGYKFRKMDDVMNALHPVLADHKVFIVPEVLQETREERVTPKGGRLHYAILKIKYTFYAPDSSSISTIMVGEGSDSSDKASNKAQTAALKYALCQVFAIPVEDMKDPDEDTPEMQPKGMDEPPAAPARPYNHAPGAQNNTPPKKWGGNASPPEGDDGLEDKIGRLVESYRKVGVSEKMICARYNVRYVGAMTETMVSDANKIGHAILKGANPSEYF